MWVSGQTRTCSPGSPVQIEADRLCGKESKCNLTVTPSPGLMTILRPVSVTFS
eukprot:CAMPEP_0174376586 /NCGR_PEP_ID=MMETSP0811_2-20130205/118648_1 /TAXON_ID=73025 ORGANISM="Eutreptiella gymnastica-like, Strain CCMP1594" /NCGR_SAMPLE_ID=MMETSP0811_2 /ASSEMBLY_ACC=CAM_ASM_000667 /LENGTH=52 /DNA_ID=CAMNT_0015527879 /DNA_START=8 /DNA_END=163 /DNA_ORIENTATION=-